MVEIPFKVMTWSDDLPGRVAATRRDDIMNQSKEIRTQLRQRPNKWAAILQCPNKNEATNKRNMLKTVVGPMGFEFAARGTYVWGRFVGEDKQQKMKIV